MTLLVSVVIPCRNEARTLRACLDALAAQDFPRDRFEVIVVDGGSTDGSRDIAQAHGVLLLDDDGRGPSAARNQGIRAARGEVVAFTDADCVPQHDWLTSIAEVFAEDPAVAGLGGALRMTRSTWLGRAEDADARANYRGFITSNAAYRRDVLLEVGGFDESLACAEDYDLAWRVVEAGHRLVHDPRPIVVHDPPEVSGSFAAYLRKQFWYARSDVPALARWARRARGSSVPASTGAVFAATDAMRRALLAASCAGTLLLAPRRARLPVALLAAESVRRAMRTARAAEEPPRTAAALALTEAAKTFARGAGTLAGLAGLAWRQAGRSLTPRGRPPRGAALPLRDVPLPRAVAR